MHRTQFDVDKEFEEYRKFAFGRNMVGIAIALVVANSCQKMVQSISEHVLMPIVNFLVNSTSGNWKDIKLSIVEGLDIDVGVIGSNLIEFVITTVILYIVYSKLIKKISPKVEIPG